MRRRRLQHTASHRNIDGLKNNCTVNTTTEGNHGCDTLVCTAACTAVYFTIVVYLQCVPMHAAACTNSAFTIAFQYLSVHSCQQFVADLS
jgi:hypothetical protein